MAHIKETTGGMGDHCLSTCLLLTPLFTVHMPLRRPIGALDAGKEDLVSLEGDMRVGACVSQSEVGRIPYFSMGDRAISSTLQLHLSSLLLFSYSLLSLLVSRTNTERKEGRETTNNTQTVFLFALGWGERRERNKIF